ncbi:MAG: redox-regulated ATPase YchF [Zetaproteobacteria bacterium]|nr:redox-regulated ATPase YchF [Pseudobdellovibrionaceae bacterium]
MGFKCGIVGLPNVGKSTIFNALTEAKAASENYPFCTIDPNVGTVAVPDTRLNEINKVIQSQKVIPTTMNFVDIAGLVKGASRGEGLGNKFLGHIRSTDAIAHVVRCFDSSDITHVEGNVDPIRDIDIIETELILADNETVESNLKRYSKLSKTGNKHIPEIITMLENLNKHLQDLKPVRSFTYDKLKDSKELYIAFRDLHLITRKPTLYVCNIHEDDLQNPEKNIYVQKVLNHAKNENSQIITLSGKIEEELVGLSISERQEMLEALGLQEPGLNYLIKKGYELLGLQTYFTAGVKEVRAWTIVKGAKAPEAAGVIHSDFERGFICAETFHYKDLVEAKSPTKLKELGLIRIEGKDYTVKDGDVIEFRFNV